LVVGKGTTKSRRNRPMATLPRSSLIQVARPEPPIPLPERITIALEALGESAREGLLAFCVGVGLSVVHEIFEEEITQLVGPRGSHDPQRRGYRHGQEEIGRASCRERGEIAGVDGDGKKK